MPLFSRRDPRGRARSRTCRAVPPEAGTGRRPSFRGTPSCPWIGDRWLWQTLYKVLALGMLLVGGVQAYTVVWDLGDVGIGLMTIFNLIALYPLSGEAIEALRDYERRKHLEH